MFTRRVGLALLLAALVCAALPVLADSNARIVRLSYLDGDVQIDRGTGNGFERAVLNLPVVQGTRLATSDGGTAEVEFEDGATLRMVPHTQVEFRKLSLRDNGERVSSVDLSQGMVYLEATKKKDEFTVTVGTQEILLNRDARLRIDHSGSGLAVAVFKGDVDVQNPTGSVRVKKDETLNLNLNDPSQYELAKGIDVDSYDTWNQQREQYRQTYASNHHDGYNAQYSYGWSDLNYYGNFSSYGNSGMLWRPAGVGPGWDPFNDGAWVYYPGYGYMWVSGYPWGWMPYRYGRWLFVPGYGWGWQPGPVWNTWYATPVIYSAPPNYVRPVAPSVHKDKPGAAPATVVVGAGPITDVRNPRFREWVKQTNGGHGPGHKAGVSPVPPPVTTTAATGNQKNTATTTTTTTTTTGTSSPARTTTRTHEQKQDGAKHNPPPARTIAPPPAAPPRSAAPRMSPPPPVSTRESTGATSGSTGATAGSSGESHSQHK